MIWDEFVYNNIYYKYNKYYDVEEENLKDISIGENMDELKQTDLSILSKDRYFLHRRRRKYKPKTIKIIQYKEKV